jgi:mRNA interferase RelE/StbE
MTFKIVFDKEPIDFLNNLPHSLKKRIFDKIILSKNNPFSHFIRLSGRIDYKLRVGDYRVIADIHISSQIIAITHIGYRKNVYKKY